MSRHAGNVDQKVRDANNVKVSEQRGLANLRAPKCFVPPPRS